jgi:hypothetical protein
MTNTLYENKHNLDAYPYQIMFIVIDIMLVSIANRQLTIFNKIEWLKYNSTKMKLLTVLSFQIIFVIGCLAQNNQTYYQHIIKAQLAFVDGDYSKASKLYTKAFKVQKPYPYDKHQAIQTELDYGKGDEKIIKQYLKDSGGKGTDMSGDTYVKNMSQTHPKFGELPYLNDIIEHFNNTEPVQQEKYVHADAFKELRDKDVQIREAAIADVGQLKMYKSHWSKPIRQVDDENIVKLLVLLQDTALNENDCHECFQNMGIVLIHAASNGNAEWVDPIVSIFNDGRMDVRRFVRMMDDAATRLKPKDREKLKEKDLYYGSFNCIRLYNLMYLMPYTDDEKHTLNRNRKKIGFKSIDDEMKIITWQFRNNDAMNFKPVIAQIYADGSEDEATIKSMLQEQEIMLQQAIEYNKENGFADLIIVRR